MKKFTIFLFVVILVGIMGASQVFAFSVPVGPLKFKFSDRSVGREYYPAVGPPITYTPETAGTWIPGGTPKGLTPSANVLTNGVMGTGDGVEDGWVGLYVTGIYNPADESIVYWTPSATEQISGIMWGIDDVKLTSLGLTAFDLQAVGGHIDLWLDNPTTGTPFKWDSNLNGLAYDEYTPGIAHWTPIFNTATDGVKLLALDAVGGIVVGGQDVAGNPVTIQESSTAITTPWTGRGSGYFDVVGGDYMSLFDSNPFNVDKNGDGIIDPNEKADFFVSFNFHTTPLPGENAYSMDAISDDPALTAAVPEPTTMLLLGSGLLGLAGFARRRFKK